MVKRILSEEQIKGIKERIDNGDKYSQISFDLRIPVSTLKYNTDEEYKNKKRKTQREYESNKYKDKGYTKEQKKIRNKNSGIYFKDRYNNDKEFREKHIQRVKEYNNKKRKKK